MHVLVIPSWYPVSPNDVRGSFFREQAIALARANCKVGVIYPQHRSIRKWYGGPFGLNRQDDNGVSVFRRNGIKWLSLFPNGNAFLWLRDGIKLYKRYVKNQGVPDIIHAHSTIYGGVLAHRIHQRFGVPYVITEHSTGYARDILTDGQRQLATDAIRNASRRYAVSEPFCKLLQDYFGIQNGMWGTLSNIVNRSFSGFPIHSSPRNSSEFVFVSIALLTQNKGIHDLICAFSRAFPHEKSVSLIIGGDGVERPHLEVLVQKLGLVSQVQFLGMLSREQVLEQVAAADAFVSSSHYETFGVAVAEALALGKPVIVTRCGGPESIVRSLGGVIVPPGDVDSLTVAMKSMRENVAKYDSREIREACISRYSEAVITSHLVTSYKKIIDSRQGSIGMYR